uniref:Presequence protease, mitochondrial n=1 Tax=Leptobrachium leishanense TaxID=445787 RepID=A0A8C5MQR3_9ANUR
MIGQLRAGLLLSRALPQFARRWSGRLAHERALEYKPGETIHGFTVNKVTPVPDLFLTAVQLSHENTGAKYLHIAREDSNNLFSVQLRTTPQDSTGAPHILEHTTLCGSEKYPCGDPFFKMLNRSLSTFMNAFTASDYTMYPFSTQNAKDFQNLMSVYLDAVFFPLLRELDFWQEGWRLEHTDPKNPSSPLIFKGIVFNEMKGALTDKDTVYAQQLQNHLLPDNTYAFVSGGDPFHIPDLTWEELKQFHATYYHPSNAKFFTYGDFPLETHLKQIHEDALSKFGRIEASTAVPAQKHWQAPREYHVACAVDSLAADPAKQTMVSVSFLLSQVTDQFESFVLNLLCTLLVDGPNSPFYKTLIESKLGNNFSPYTGFNDHTRDTYFSVGLQGISKEDVATVKNIIHRTIDEVIESGFEPERIEGFLHKLELQMRHQSTKFGLYLATDNPHMMTFSMSPEDDYNAKQAELESQKLNQKVTALSEEARKAVYEKGLELINLQTIPPDASCLPALKVSDIERTIPLTELDVAYSGAVPVQYSPQPTNGMVYFRAVSSLNSLPEELKPYVPLFCSVVTKMGCGVYNYREQAQQMELTTGGMEVTPKVVPHHSNLDAYEQGILFSSICLDRNMPDMMHLWSEIFSNPHLNDVERLKVLVKMSAQELSNGIPGSGHQYACIRAARTLTPAGELDELFTGMDQVNLMQRIADMPDMSSILRKLSRIRKYVLLSDSLRCSVNATPQQIPIAAKEVDRFLAGLHRNKKERKAVRPNIVETSCGQTTESEDSKKIIRKLVCEPNFKPCQMKTQFNLAFPVNYIGECIRTVPFTDPDFASLRLLAQVMSAKYIHREVREKGGAYGGGAQLGVGGLVTFYSYRDPNSMSTLNTFQKAIEWAKSEKFTEDDLNEAKLSVFSKVDSPVAPADQGMNQFLSGISDDMRQRHRERLFAATYSDLVNAAGKYLSMGKGTRAATILGPDNEAIKKDPTWIRLHFPTWDFFRCLYTSAALLPNKPVLCDATLISMYSDKIM